MREQGSQESVPSSTGFIVGIFLGIFFIPALLWLTSVMLGVSIYAAIFVWVGLGLLFVIVLGVFNFLKRK